jgi:hypothetical protein
MTNRGYTDRAIGDIGQERLRQIGVEGFDAAHDDAHDDGALAKAAAFFAAAASLDNSQRAALRGFNGQDPEVAAVLYLRPDWHARWLQLHDRRGDLVRAAALIIAEIERLDRAGGKEEVGGAGAGDA